VTLNLGQQHLEALRHRQVAARTQPQLSDGTPDFEVLSSQASVFVDTATSHPEVDFNGR
jgi:DNA-binding transcriptional regulator YbjK